MGGLVCFKLMMVLDDFIGLKVLVVIILIFFVVWVMFVLVILVLSFVIV